MGPSTIFLLSLFSLLIPAQSAPDPTLDSNWQLWVKTHQKTYKDAEEEGARRIIWEEKLKYITVHNLEYSLGLHTYEVGMNHLGDMTGEEVAATMTGYTGSDLSLANVIQVPKELLKAQPPASMDWRTQECVTPVKCQGSCKSCYAFSTVGALECQWKLKTGRLLTFSSQELVDCSDPEGNVGCYGGRLNSSFTYMKENGLMEETAYPYTERKAQCKRIKPSNSGKVKNFYKITTGNENHLRIIVGTVGPVSVAIYANHTGFHDYKSGVYYDPYCTTKQDHAVLVVGYGTEKGMDYWLVKNSWGCSWGEDGYIKMARNHCGIAQDAIYPSV
ncbi:cathepsin S [Xenopus laevis]|uniref:Cathepsin S n=2 Tax=Xenopus laevis TaxID=8355 RepID=A0A1L8FBP9_XENLA|nr:cathepsin S [Xenopus laevis]OCT69029.1 hypothetical protein XELAEV_18040337mg [Xenopus laevis]